MLESKFSRDMRAKLSPRIHWSRIENLAGPGIPDIHGRLGPSHAWVETKIVKSQRIEVRWSQLTWLALQIQASGQYDSNVWYVARAGNFVQAWSGLHIHRSAQLAKAEQPPILMRVRKDNDSMTWKPGLPDFSRAVGLPETWTELGTLLFGSIYRTALAAK